MSNQEEPLYLCHEHFSCFEHDHGPNPSGGPKYKSSELWEADTYRFEFNLAMFVKSLLVFLFDISGLGLLTFLFKMITGSKFLSNFYEICTTSYFIRLIGWINTLLLIYCIYQRNFIFTDAKSLIYFVGLVFLSIMEASFNCYLNGKIPPLLNSVELSEESQKSICITYTLLEADKRKEFKRTTLRLNIDASSFFMTFLEKLNGEEQLKRKRETENQPDIKEEGLELTLTRKASKGEQKEEGHQLILDDKISKADIKEEGHNLILEKPIKRADLVAKAVEFEGVVFDYKFLTKPTRYDNDKIYGYTYAGNILDTYQPRMSSFVFLSYIGSFGVVAVSFMNLDGSDESSEGFVKKYIIKGGVLLINVVINCGVLNMVMESALVLWTRLDFVKGMTGLVSEEKSSEESMFRKQYNSMINIFDAESLRTWASLRMVFMNMNQKKLEAASLGTSLVVAIQLIGLLILGFFYFTSTEVEQKDFFLKYIIFFGTPALIYMTFVLSIIYFGSQVNNQYQEHIYLLKKLKMTIFKLFAMYASLKGEGSVQPSTYLYARGIRYLEQAFGDQEITQKLLDEELQKINEAYEEVIEELETEEQYSPLKILGIPMTDSFVTTVLGTILTVITIPASKYLADLTGWG